MNHQQQYMPSPTAANMACSSLEYELQQQHPPQQQHASPPTSKYAEEDYLLLKGTDGRVMDAADWKYANSCTTTPALSSNHHHHPSFSASAPVKNREVVTSEDYSRMMMTNKEAKYVADFADSVLL
jgi:hypothetical protein